ncbi:MAG: hypothetical protein FJ149_03770 [Euryarchaeota archaeon]|nr:hypothetical protein [Euryarchaeota archaeon]
MSTAERDGTGGEGAGGPGKAGPPEATQREASRRPLEATAGVPDHGEREPPAGLETGPGDAGSAGTDGKEPLGEGAAKDGGPDGAAPPAPEVKIIEAPEAKPVSEMAPALTPSEAKPVLPDEGGVVIISESAGVEWGEEEVAGPGAPPPEGKPAPPAGERGAEAPVPAAPGPAVPAPVEAGPAPAAPAAPAEAGGGGLPRHPPLPSQFLGTGRDIRRFVRNGTFMFFLGWVVYFVVGALCLGMAFLDAFDDWAGESAGAWSVAGFLALGLSAGALVCMLLSRGRLEEPLRRNDVGALRRRLPVATGAGLIFGLVLGGVLLHLALVKVGELPSGGME